MSHYLQLDMSELRDTIGAAKALMSQKAFTQMMYHTLKDSCNRTVTIVKRSVPNDYEVRQKWVAKHIKKPKISVGREMVAQIPIEGVRGSIGGTFAIMGKPGRKPKLTSKKRIKSRRNQTRARQIIRTKIVKGKYTTLPDKMDHQGGQPPFVAQGIAFTRKYAGRPKPIVRVVGLGVPQMPLNLSRDRIQKQVVAYAGERLDHYFKRMVFK